MMAGVEDGVRKLLAGEAMPVPPVGINYNTNDQQQSGFLPICKRTVTYIVMAVLFDDRDRVVLIQEAKQSCHGKWYLPAGRVEPGENLIAAVEREVQEEAGVKFRPHTLLGVAMSRQRAWFRFLYLGTPTGTCSISACESNVPYTWAHLLDGARREVQEEAGFVFEPESLVYVEIQSVWWRFTYVGKVTGGKLKTLAEQDGESLQANWFTLEQIRNGFVPLRYKDILPALEMAEKYRSQAVETRHPASGVVVQPHRYLIHRMLVFQQSQDGKVDILCYKKDGYHIPCCHIRPHMFSIQGDVRYLASHVFKESEKQLRLQGVVSVEHCGTPAREHDGLCLTSAVIVHPHNSDGKQCSPQDEDYEWISIGKESLAHEIQCRIFLNNLLLPINFYE